METNKTNSKEKDGFSPIIFTTHPKNGHRHKKKTNSIYEDSIAKRRFFSIDEELKLKGLFEGKLYHLSFDCPKPLGLTFKQATHDNGTSICKELQKFMYIYLVAVQTQKTALGNTISKVPKSNLNINLTSNQYVQSRPRRLVRNVEPQKLTLDGKLTCQIGNCNNLSDGKGVYLETGKEFLLCKLHLNEYSKSSLWSLTG
jgi:hypothetical protein